MGGAWRIKGKGELYKGSTVTKMCHLHGRPQLFYKGGAGGGAEMRGWGEGVCSRISARGGGGGGGGGRQVRPDTKSGGGGGGGGAVRFRTDRYEKWGPFVWHTANTLSLIINGYNFGRGGA